MDSDTILGYLQPLDEQIGDFIVKISDNAWHACSVVAVTFMSCDLCSHVLCRVRHLVNRIVLFLESRVFSSLAKLLQCRRLRVFEVM